MSYIAKFASYSNTDGLLQNSIEEYYLEEDEYKNMQTEIDMNPITQNFKITQPPEEARSQASIRGAHLAPVLPKLSPIQSDQIS